MFYSFLALYDIHTKLYLTAPKAAEIGPFLRYMSVTVFVNEGISILTADPRHSDQHLLIHVRSSYPAMVWKPVQYRTE